MRPHHITTVIIYPAIISVMEEDFDDLDFSKEFRTTLCEAEVATFYHNALRLKD